MHDARPSLSYAPRAGWTRRKAFRRSLAAVLLLAGAVLLWRVAPPVSRQARYLYDQRACMNHVLPPDRAVFENDAEAAAALLTRPDEYRPPARPLFDEPWYPMPPATWQPPAHYYLPAADRLAIFMGDGLAFAHQRRTPAGVTRLVLVKFGCTAFGPDGYTVILSARPLTPATWQLGSRALVPNHRGSEAAVFIPLKGSHRLRLLAGQPHPTDASRFTIRYELNGSPGTIEGRLHDGKPPGGSALVAAETIELDPNGPVVERMQDDMHERWLRRTERRADDSP